MISAHATHTAAGGAGGLETVLPGVALVAFAAGYVLLALLRGREPRGWSPWRTASFLAGIGLLLLALVPSLSPFPAGDFRGHMYQHLLIEMYAPWGWRWVRRSP